MSICRATIIPLSLAIFVLMPRMAHAQAPDTARIDSAASPDSVARAAVAAPAGVPSSRSGVRVLAVGDTVRIRSGAGRYEGRIARVTADTLFIAAPGREDAVLRGDVSEVLRSTGRGPRGRAILLGAGVGALAGGGIGFAAGHFAGRIEHCDDVTPGCVVGSHDRTIGGALTAEGAIVGGLLGAMLGPAFRRTHWEIVSAGATPVQAAPSPGGGMQIGVHLQI